eukprot:Trichotokara_eunicae@DN8138_c0_g1_i1.p1
MELISFFTSPEEVEFQIKQMIARREILMGFGHRQYKNGDPRSPMMKGIAKHLAESGLESSDPLLLEIAEKIDETVFREKNIKTNVDFYAGLTLTQCCIPRSMFTPFFVFARCAGWTAHILEQRANNRLIRPSSEYVGPAARKITPLSQRGNSHL